MNSVLYGFVLTSLAGFSTMIGTMFIFFKRKENIVVKALSFAAGVMVTISLIDLIPEGNALLKMFFYKIPAFLIGAIFIVCGILLSMMIDKYIPDSSRISSDNKTLYRVGIISMIAIILHNIPEGIATFMATSKDMALGISLAIAIAFHNIPEGISISIPIYCATGSRKRALFYAFISGISELFGAVLAYFFLSSIMNDMIMGMLFFVIAGIMLHISFYELLPTAKSYKNNKMVLLYFVIGILFMLINHICF